MAHHLFHRRRLIEGLPILHTAYTIIHTTSLTRIKPTASLLATLYMLYIMYKTHTHLHTSADASLHQDITPPPVSYTHLRAHETKANLVCRLLLEKKKNTKKQNNTTTKTLMLTDHCSYSHYSNI